MKNKQKEKEIKVLQYYSLKQNYFFPHLLNFDTIYFTSHFTFIIPLFCPIFFRLPFCFYFFFPRPNFFAKIMKVMHEYFFLGWVRYDGRTKMEVVVSIHLISYPNPNIKFKWCNMKCTDEVSKPQPQWMVGKKLSIYSLIKKEKSKKI